MSNPNEQTLLWLSVALEMERKGKAFYDKAIGDCKNPLGHEIFKTLMKDEVVHENRIKAIYKQLEGGKEWNEEWAKMDVNHKALEPFFTGLVAKQGANVKGDTNDIKALEVGIDLETRSIEFYESNLKVATDAKEKAFLDRMVTEEKSHHKVLTDLKFYLSNPAAWFAEHERSGYDG